ncbi:MAG: acyltransferase [Gammaproteobacteria bacterium]|nr:acyltransferase [Gammaproteobacteria bacterium]
MTGATASLKTGIWAHAGELAARTPAERNRYVDFLRAVSIALVVTGHWLVAVAYVQGGELKLDDLLHVSPWAQWLTWIFQVMPLFFIVGGYSNGISWESACRSGRGYAAWLAARLKRLVGPVVPLLIAWVVMAMTAAQLGVRPQFIQLGSQMALIPTWFLAVYIMVVVFTPVTYRAWRRFGVASFWGLALVALAVDITAFAFAQSWLRWTNYAFVWLAVHQLGYLWRAGRITGVLQALAWAAAGLAVLLFLVFVSAYPVSMITVPGEAVSNSRPPTLALLALGVFHAGLVLALEAPLRRWLLGARVWTTTVLVNGIIMTVYLWHVTVMVLVIGLANLLGGFGLGLQPATLAWWSTRPVWIAVLAAFLFACVAAFGRFEQGAKSRVASSPPAWQSITGAICVCAALVSLALNGIGAEGVTGIRVGAVILVLAGAGLVLGLPQRVFRS